MFCISITAMICKKCQQLENEILFNAKTDPKIIINNNNSHKNELKDVSNELERLNALRQQIIDIIILYKETFQMLIMVWLSDNLLSSFTILNTIYCLLVSESPQFIDILSYYCHFCREIVSFLIVFIAYTSIKLNFNCFQRQIH